MSSQQLLVEQQQITDPYERPDVSEYISRVAEHEAEIDYSDIFERGVGIKDLYFFEDVLIEGEPRRVMAFRHEGLPDEVSEKIASFLYMTYLSKQVGFYDPSVAMETGAVSEDLRMFNPRDIHYMIGKQEGDKWRITAYVGVQRFNSDTAFADKDNRPSTYVETVHGDDVFDRYPAITTMPMNQIGLFRRLVVREGEVKPLNTARLMITMINTLNEAWTNLREEVKLVIGDLEPNRAGRQLEAFGVPSIELQGTSPDTSRLPHPLDRILRFRYLNFKDGFDKPQVRVVVPFAFLTGDLNGETATRTREIQDALDKGLMATGRVMLPNKGRRSDKQSSIVEETSISYPTVEA